MEYFCFGRSPGRDFTAPRIPNDEPLRTTTTTPFTRRGEVRKFRGFEARSLSLFDDESQRLFKSAPSLLLETREGVLETNANPLRPDETAGVSFDRYPKKNRARYIHYD